MVLKELVQDAKELFNSKITTYAMAGIIGVTGAVGFFQGYKGTGDTQVGIKTNTLNIPYLMSRGVSNEIYEPASRHIILPFISDWHTLETGVQQLEFTCDGTIDETTLNCNGTDNRLRFKTQDGNDIEFELTILYQVERDSAPHIIRNVAQSDRELREKIVRPAARSTTRDFYGLLSTEQFAQADPRNNATTAAIAGLDAELEMYGVNITDIRTGTFKFANDKFREAAANMQKAKLDRDKHVAAFSAAVQNNETMLSNADAYVNTRIAQADGRFRQDSIAADGQFLRDSSSAVAILAEGEATAEALGNERRAMNSAGGRTQVLQAINDAIKNKPIYMLPGMGEGSFQTFDLNDFIGLTGIRSLIEQGNVRPPAAPPSTDNGNN